MAKAKVRASFGGAARTADQIQQYREVSVGYDRRVRAGERLRTQAFAEFDLRIGDVVLDVGCGTGLSFPLIENAIGSSGTLIGIDQSAEMLALAGRRVADARWKNVTLIETPIQYATIAVLADVLILCRVHEITRSAGALANVFRCVTPGARVLVVGAKWAPWWAFPLNIAIWLSVRQVTTTLKGFRQPWDLVQRYVPDLRVRSVALGAHYIAHGTTPSA